MGGSKLKLAGKQVASSGSISRFLQTAPAKATDGSNGRSIMAAGDDEDSGHFRKRPYDNRMLSQDLDDDVLPNVVWAESPTHDPLEPPSQQLPHSATTTSHEPGMSSQCSKDQLKKSVIQTVMAAHSGQTSSGHLLHGGARAYHSQEESAPVWPPLKPGSCSIPGSGSKGASGGCKTEKNEAAVKRSTAVAAWDAILSRPLSGTQPASKATKLGKLQKQASLSPQNCSLLSNTSIAAPSTMMCGLTREGMPSTMMCGLTREGMSSSSLPEELAPQVDALCSARGSSCYSPVDINILQPSCSAVVRTRKPKSCCKAVDVEHTPRPQGSLRPKRNISNLPTPVTTARKSSRSSSITLKSPSKARTSTPRRNPAAAAADNSGPLLPIGQTGDPEAASTAGTVLLDTSSNVHKRQALMELLEQVELVVQNGSSEKMKKSPVLTDKEFGSRRRRHSVEQGESKRARQTAPSPFRLSMEIQPSQDKHLDNSSRQQCNAEDKENFQLMQLGVNMGVLKERHLSQIQVPRNDCLDRPHQPSLIPRQQEQCNLLKLAPHCDGIKAADSATAPSLPDYDSFLDDLDDDEMERLMSGLPLTVLPADKQSGTAAAAAQPGPDNKGLSVDAHTLKGELENPVEMKQSAPEMGSEGEGRRSGTGASRLDSLVPKAMLVDVKQGSGFGLASPMGWFSGNLGAGSLRNPDCMVADCMVADCMVADKVVQKANEQGGGNLIDSVLSQPLVDPQASALPCGREQVHYIVLEVLEPFEEELALRLFNEYKGQELIAHLRDGWADTPVKPGDSLNIVGGKWEAAGTGNSGCVKHLIVDSSQGLVILHPDLLLSGTSIMAAMRCPRQAWLQEQLAGDTNDKAVLGQLLHELLQSCMNKALRPSQASMSSCTAKTQPQERSLTRDWLLKEIHRILAVSSNQLYEAGLEEKAAFQIMSNHIPSLLSWACTYLDTAAADSNHRVPVKNVSAGQLQSNSNMHQVSCTTSGRGCVRAPGSKAVEPAQVSDSSRSMSSAGGTLDMGPNSNRGGEASTVSIVEILDIEENIWAPRFGLKGQLDATLRVEVTRKEMVGMHPSASHRIGPTGSLTTTTSANSNLASHHPGNAAVDSGCPAPSMTTSCTSNATSSVPSWSGEVVRQRPVPSIRTYSSGPGAKGGAMEEVTRSVLVPFEFKSGKEYMGHRGQVALYLLLMEERYGQEFDLGLLWNIHNPGMQAVQKVHNELAALISHRNRLAAHMVPSRDDAGAPAAPAMLIDNYACDKCPAVETCAIYHKSVERGNHDTSGLPPARFLALTQHLSTAHCAFLEHWYPLIGMEEEASKGQRPQVWALSGKQREALGTCLPGLKFKAYSGVQSFPDGPKHCYVFTSHAVRGRADKDNSGNSDLLGHMSKRGGSFEDLCMGSLEQGGTSLLSSSFSVGDMALLSVEGRHPVLARVSVAEVTQDYLTVTSKRAIQLSTLSALSTAQIIKGPTSTDTAQSTLGNVKGMHGSITPPSIPCHSNELPVPLPNLDQGILTAAEDQRQSLHDMTNLPVPIDTEATSTTGLCHHTPGAGEGLSALSWRLDRDESSSTFNLMRSNLLSLLAPPGTMKGSIASRLRQLIIDGHPPQQYNRTSGTLEGSTESLDDQAALCGSSLNPEQQEAVSKVLQMRDYALVLGMPGTGKTSTIVSMIRALLSAGRTILVTSYTNSAVDNILLKLIEEQTKQEANHERGHANVDMSFLRIGNCQAVHPSVRPYLLGGTRNPITSASDVQHIATHSRIVATTCLSCRHALLSQRTFDVAIVDEASQISVPAIVGPLCLARSFVLIGDHYQLSPLVTNKRAQEAGLGTSLFRMLCQAAPQAVTTLRNQYRMADDIMYLSNHLVYNGAMICGSDSVAAAQLVLPKYMAMKQSAMLQSEWLLKALDPEQRVIFLDTSKVPGTSEQQLGDGVSNQGEVMLISALLHHLLLAGLPPSDVGVISPYKAQVAALLQESRKVVSRWQQNMPRSIYRSGAAAAISTKEGFQEERMPEFFIGAASAPGLDLDLHHDGPTSSSSTDNLLLPSRAVEDAVEVLTVDRYQGRDKPCIIISLVRSNSSGKAGRLLADWQRINVAITRAKHKLVFVGCADSLKELPMMSALVDALSNRGWCLQLPPSCLQGLEVRA